MKFFRAAAATLGFFVVLPVIYVVHARYFRVDVVFYSALLDVVIATLVCSLALWRWSGFSVLGAFEKVQLMAIWLLSGYVFAISVPTVIDRSLSFYLLEKLEQRGGGIRQEAFERIIANEFMHEYRLVDSRLTEQMDSGTIEIRNGCVLLTQRGRTLAGLSRQFRTRFLPKQRLLMGEYSADLTDPFKRSANNPDYQCRRD